MVSEQCITHKMILPILTDENPQLREISAPVKTIDASTKKLIKDLLAKGFKKPQIVQQANLEDVYIDLTGKALRD